MIPCLSKQRMVIAIGHCEVSQTGDYILISLYKCLVIFHLPSLSLSPPFNEVWSKH